jgi:hypothetical protein
MALEDMMGIMSIAPAILRDFPAIMGVMQWISYIFLALFFGSIAIKGYRGYMNTWVRLGVRFGIGFFCLVMGFTIASFIPVETTNAFLLMIQRDLINTLVGGLISSFTVMGTIFLATHNIFDIQGMTAHVKRMEEKLRKAEQISREESKKDIQQKIMDPYRFAGIVVFIILLIFTIAAFPGFPDAGENLLSTLGLEQEDLDTLLQQIGGDQALPQGCESLLAILQANGDDLINNRLPTSNDQTARSLATAEGHTPVAMYRANYNGDEYILVVSSDSYMCHVKDSQLCGCLDVSSFITMTS